MNQKIPLKSTKPGASLKKWPAKLKLLFAKFKKKGPSSDEVLDHIQALKKERSKSKQTEVGLMLLLFILILTQWKWGLAWLQEVDQLENDLGEQEEVIEMEEANRASLKQLEDSHDQLRANLETIYAALPQKDEEAENMLPMLEDMATQNRIILESIGIRSVPESQINYHALHGVVEVYEYSFAIESDLPNILSFITSLRSSMRLIDIMAMEIEEVEVGYRAGFLLHAYHLTTDQDDF